MTTPPPTQRCRAVRWVHAANAHPHAVLDCHHPQHGTVAVIADSPTRHLAPLARAVFAALAPSGLSDERVRATKDQLPLVTLALHNHTINHLVIDHAERASPAALTSIVTLTLAADTTPWLITRQHNDQFDWFLAGWPHQRHGWNTAHKTLTAPRADDTAPVEPARHPWHDIGGMPTAEFPYFRAALAETDQHAFLDAAYTTALQATRTALGPPPTTPEAVLAELRRRLYDAVTVDHAVLLCRATTAAAFTHGTWLHADTDILTQRLPSEPSFATRHRADHHLGDYRRSTHPAIAALAALGLPVDTITNLTIEDLATLTDTTPPSLSPLLRRHLLHRLMHGAHRVDPALVLVDGQPTNARRVRAVLRELGHDTDHGDTRRRRPQRDPLHVWARRLGITARRIHD